MTCAIAIAVCYTFHIGHGHFAFSLGQAKSEQVAPAPLPPTVPQWSAFSTIEADDENSRFRETILIVNDNGTPTTFGAITVAPGEGVQFVHWIAAARKKDFAHSVNVEGVEGDVPVKIIVVKGAIEREDLK